jgi:predicted metal-dependent hydrolase
MNNALRNSITFFNRREYFACHEVLEEAWQEATKEDREFYQGFVQLATALHLRFHRGGHKGTINLLTQALVHLENYRPQYQNVDVDTLYQQIETYLEGLRSSRRERASFFERFQVPRIRLV